MQVGVKLLGAMLIHGYSKVLNYEVWPMNSDKPRLHLLEPSDQDATRSSMLAISALFKLVLDMFLVHVVEYLEFGTRVTSNYQEHITVP